MACSPQARSPFSCTFIACTDSLAAIKLRSIVGNTCRLPSQWTLKSGITMQACAGVLTELCACQAALTMEQGGHSAAVQCLVPIGQFLFSADWNGDIKVTEPRTGSAQLCLAGQANLQQASLRSGHPSLNSVISSNALGSWS